MPRLPHRHRPSRAASALADASTPRPFLGGLWAPSSWRAEPRAHGGSTVVERCACGAQRRTNLSSGWAEVGPWEAA